MQNLDAPQFVVDELAQLEHWVQQFLNTVVSDFSRGIPERLILTERLRTYCVLAAKLASLYDARRAVIIAEVTQLGVPPEAIEDSVASDERVIRLHHIAEVLMTRVSSELRELFCTVNVQVKRYFELFVSAMAKFCAKERRQPWNVPTLLPCKTKDVDVTKTFDEVAELRLSYQSLLRDASALCRAVQSVRSMCRRFSFTAANGVIRCDLIDVERIVRILFTRYSVFVSIQPPGLARIADAASTLPMRIHETGTANALRKLIEGVVLQSPADTKSAIPGIVPYGQNEEASTRKSKPGPDGFCKQEHFARFEQKNSGSLDAYTEAHIFLQVTQAPELRPRPPSDPTATPNGAFWSPADVARAADRVSSATEPYYFVFGLPASVLSEWAQSVVLNNVPKENRASCCIAALSIPCFVSTNPCQNSDAAASAFWYRMFSIDAPNGLLKPRSATLDELLASIPDLVRGLLPFKRQQNARLLDRFELQELERTLITKLIHLGYIRGCVVTLAQFAPLTATDDRSQVPNGPRSAFHFIYQLVRLLGENDIIFNAFNLCILGHFLDESRRVDLLRQDRTKTSYAWVFCSEVPGKFFFISANGSIPYVLNDLPHKAPFLAAIKERIAERTPLFPSGVLGTLQWHAFLARGQQAKPSAKRQRRDTDQRLASAVKVFAIVMVVEATRVTCVPIGHPAAELEFTRDVVLDVGGIDRGDAVGFYGQTDLTSTSLFQRLNATLLLVCTDPSTGSSRVLKAEAGREMSIQISQQQQQQRSIPSVLSSGERPFEVQVSQQQHEGPAHVRASASTDSRAYQSQGSAESSANELSFDELLSTIAADDQERVLAELMSLAEQNQSQQQQSQALNQPNYFLVESGRLLQYQLNGYPQNLNPMVRSFIYNPSDYRWQVQHARRVLGLPAVTPAVVDQSAGRNVPLDMPPFLKLSIRGSGGCLFDSISFLLAGSTEFGPALRRAVVAFIRANDDRMRSYLGMTAEAYLLGNGRRGDMALDTTWATEIEIEVLATILNTPIRVFARVNDRLLWNLHDPRPDWSSEPPGAPLSNCAMHISNDGGVHFEPVVQMLGP